MGIAFGRRLKTLRTKRRLSQSKLGRAVGVHYNQIGLYERGAAMPSSTVLAALGKALGVTADALLHDPPAEPVQPKQSPAAALDARLTELTQAARSLSEPDRRTVVALLEAFVLKSRIAALASEMQER